MCAVFITNVHDIQFSTDEIQKKLFELIWGVSSVSLRRKLSWIYLHLEGICPYGQLPILEFDDVVLAQSMAILRYLAREHGKYFWVFFDFWVSIVQSIMYMWVSTFLER